MNARDPLLWALAVPAVLAIGLLVWAALPVLTGTEVLLATRPVDPPDPLRGDYVDLSYPIGTLPTSAFSVGDRIHVVLRPGAAREPTTGEPYWDAVRWARERPEVGEGEACFGGDVVSVGGGRTEVRYGIESYFIPKDETLEDWQGKEVSVVAKVSGCTPRIVGIRLDGVPWEP